MFTWQLRGDPETSDCGQTRATGFKLTSASVVCAVDVPILAVSCALSSWLMSALVAVNVADELPAAACTTAGTVNCVLLELSWILVPVEGAGPESVISHALVPPPVSVCGLQETVEAVTFVPNGASSVNDWDSARVGAPTDAVVIAATAEAVTENVALVIPAPMVTACGTVRLGLLEVSDMDLLEVAGLPRLNVQVLDPGVWIEEGVQSRLAPEEAAVTFRVVERTTAPIVADIVELPDALAATDAVNPADEAPGGISIEEGTVTCGLLLLSVAVTPLPATGPVIETVQPLAEPAATVAGEQTTEFRVACAATATLNVATPLL